MRDNPANNNPHLPNWLRPTKSAVEASADGEVLEEEGLPSLGEGQYRAYGRPANKPLFSLHFVTPGGDVRSFQYAHLDSDSRYSGGAMRIRFVGAASLGLPPIQILIEGRNLWTLYSYIHQHRTPWVLTAARDFVANGEPIVTGVTFTELGVEENDGR